MDEILHKLLRLEHELSAAAPPGPGGADSNLLDVSVADVDTGPGHAAQLASQLLPAVRPSRSPAARTIVQ